ncbi:hypothetical protein BJ508DRAFT_380410 [Ascobolus immersus RN42]|uniref:CBM-cenC domain-containing protein n=1 Tax=Ascobolus immersus RN42 TaxID=1160509 RepID=A0A3N4HSL5_ASCIM|nr:hypothetical protein BJ508DRAFT_380410 [Ascobolus immersus RN42]
MKLSILLTILPLFLAEASANAIFARQAVCSTKTVTKTATRTATKTNTKLVTNTKMITNTKLITKTNTKTLTKSATKTITTTKPAVTKSVVSTVTSIALQTTTEKVKVIKIKEKTKTKTATVTAPAEVVTSTVTASPEAVTVTEKAISTLVPPQNTSTADPVTVTKTVTSVSMHFEQSVSVSVSTVFQTLTDIVTRVATATVTVTQTPTAAPTPTCPTQAITDPGFDHTWPVDSWTASEPVLMSAYRPAGMCGRSNVGNNDCYHFYGEWGLNKASSLKLSTEATYCAGKTYRLSFWTKTKDFPADCTIRAVSRGPAGETVIGTATQSKDVIDQYKQAGPWNFQAKSEKETLSLEISCISNHYRWLALDDIVVEKI